MRRVTLALYTATAGIVFALIPESLRAEPEYDSYLDPIMTTSELPNIPDVKNKEYAAANSVEELQYNIFNDTEFYVPLAYLGHYLGFGWAGGTNSRFVGGDMEVNRIDSTTYTINARYNSNDPYADGYRASERLKIKLKDVQLVTNPADLVLGEPEVHDLEELSSLDAVVYNCGNTEDTAPIDIGYIETRSWSKSFDYSFTESASVTNKYSVGLPGIGGTAWEFTVNFAANQKWGSTNGETVTISRKAQYRAQIPSMSKRYITLTLFNQKSSIPYHSFAYLSYNIDLEGFLRWSGNARSDHPTDRPYITYSFGKNDGLNGPQQVLDEYQHSYIEGYSVWDWQWMSEEFGQSNLEVVLGTVAKRKYGGPMSGKFMIESSSQYNIVAGAPIPLTADEIATLPRCTSPAMWLTTEAEDKASSSAALSGISMSLGEQSGD
ncbi:aerolysin family beta-barrel pore-forming toxin [Vibrio sp. S4M6]|uniref:aerolysin family beta-barrel pore-forming toxin n=1 Tax=Vibrio sinus TaxID=2946865 RepID=UPI00202AAF2E|nr:aerolysin family beta-barrel pore-forming toxin [Vibrio sinus]MCL9781326.1 aerolysin family beta-barrel pore-forming toxin [Vibrio sinus]